MSGTHVPLQSVQEPGGTIPERTRSSQRAPLLAAMFPGASAVADGGRNLRLTITERQPERIDTPT